MTKLVAASVLSLIAALPAAAQTLDINDDGFTIVPEDTSSGPSVDIDDDGWSPAEAPAADGFNEVVGSPGSCTELESSAGITGDECGTLTREQIIQRLDG